MADGKMKIGKLNEEILRPRTIKIMLLKLKRAFLTGSLASFRVVFQRKL